MLFPSQLLYYIVMCIAMKVIFLCICLAHANLEDFNLDCNYITISNAGKMLWLFEHHKCLVLVTSVDSGIKLVTLDSGHKLSYLQYNNLLLLNKMEVRCGFMIITPWNMNYVVNVVREIRKFCRTNTGILIATVGANLLDEYKKVFAVAWSMRLKHVVVLEDDSEKVITYDPFSKKTYQLNVNEEGAIRRHYLFQNYQGLQLKATLFENVPNCVKLGNTYTGIDPLVMQTFAEKHNLSIQHFEPRDGEMFGNVGRGGNATGIFAELYSEAADIAFNQAFIKFYQDAPEITFTDYIMLDNVCVVVPRAPVIPSWMYIFYVASGAAWAMFGMAFLTSCAVLLVFRRLTIKIYGRTNNLRAHPSAACLNLVQIYVSIISTRLYPSHSYFRIFLATLMFSTFIINTAFQGTLMTIILHPKHFPNINTVKRLEESGLEISTSASGLMEIFDFRSKVLKKRLKLLSRDLQAFPAKLSRVRKEKYKIDMKIDRKMHVVAEHLEKYLQAYMTLEDPYFGDDLNKIIRQIRESGLTSKWYTDTVTNSLIYFGVDRKATVDDWKSSRAFTLADLYSAFVILIVGLALSAAALIGELIYRYYSSRRPTMKKYRKTTLTIKCTK